MQFALLAEETLPMTDPTDWVLTTDPDRATHPDPKETLVPLDLAADADPEEKTRLFQTGLAWYVHAPGLHAPAKTTQDTLYPILLTLAGSPAAIKASRSNFQLGAYGRVHPASERVHGGHLRLDLLPAGAFRWHASALTHPTSDQTDQVLTAAHAGLFEREGGVDAQRVEFAQAPRLAPGPPAGRPPGPTRPRRRDPGARGSLWVAAKQRAPHPLAGHRAPLDPRRAAGPGPPGPGRA
jgi:hypothetical protein